MPAVVRIHPSFKNDLVLHLAALRRDDRIDRIARLRTDVREACRLLRRFPRVGTIEAQDEHAALRRLILRQVPYVVWFIVEGKVQRTVTLVRLFHACQARPRP